LLQPLKERRKAILGIPIVRSRGHQYADAPYSLAVLRARRERPGDRCAEKRDEFAPLHVRHGDFLPYALSAPPTDPCARFSGTISLP
jgi:hypothetical protein